MFLSILIIFQLVFLGLISPKDMSIILRHENLAWSSLRPMNIFHVRDIRSMTIPYPIPRNKLIPIALIKF
uniref:Uncharacterized protein n=1 Tax=Meloidogyne enterolobii TaxID=390850 RepID=A0A6V7TZ93_MELEN|nr:unnamed protein product [Meloidogyne enterolobii]